MKRNTLGFTLIELLIALSILSLTLGIGLPSMIRLLDNTSLSSAYQQLFSLIQFTRIQAVNYQGQVLLCPTNDRSTCVNNWQQELMVFVDRNDDEIRNNDEELLQIASPQPDNGELKVSLSGSKRYLRYKADGSTRNQNGRFTLCLPSGEEMIAKQIIMYKSGRAREASEEEALEKCGAS